MHAEERQSGLIILREKKPEPAKPKEPEYDGSQPLPQGNSECDWIARLTPEQKDELLGFLPVMFLRCGGVGIFGRSAMTDLVCQLRARASFLADTGFEEFT